MSNTTPKNMCDDAKSDARLNVLYSPFRRREVNPRGWDSKMAYWKTSINDWCTTTNNFVFSLLTLQSVFVRNQKPASCLATVLEDMLRCGEVIRMQELLSKDPATQSWSSWAVNCFVKAPVVWSLSKLKESLVQKSDSLDEKLVHLDVLKKQSDQLVDQFRSQGEKLILNFDEVKSALGTMDNLNAQVLLHWLQLQSIAAVRIVGRKTVVKLSSDSQPVSPVSDAEVGLMRLQHTEQLLKRALEELEGEKLEAETEARSYIRENKREAAKSCLRKKRVLDKCIDKKATALENVQVLLSRLRDTESDGEIIDAYKMGLSAIKGTLKDAGLSEDGVCNTMDEVKEVLEIHDEIQNAMAEPMATGLDQDLEGELAELLATSPVEKDSENTRQYSDIPDLPEPPSHSPTVDKTTSSSKRVAQSLH